MKRREKSGMHGKVNKLGDNLGISATSTYSRGEGRSVVFSHIFPPSDQKKGFLLSPLSMSL
jgi:hypothetical protein